MAANSFDQNHLEAIAKMVRSVNPEFCTKRSEVYQNAVVIGRPNQNGAIILSLTDDIDESRSVWLSHTFSGADPKALADGKVNLGIGEENRDYCWGDMLSTIKKLVQEF